MSHFRCFFLFLQAHTNTVIGKASKSSSIVFTLLLLPSLVVRIILPVPPNGSFRVNPFTQLTHVDERPIPTRPIVRLPHQASDFFSPIVTQMPFYRCSENECRKEGVRSVCTLSAEDAYQCVNKLNSLIYFPLVCLSDSYPFADVVFVLFFPPCHWFWGLMLCQFVLMHPPGRYSNGSWETV